MKNFTVRSPTRRLMRLAIFFTPWILGVTMGDCLAQIYPARPVRIIVPSTPGSGIDTVARTVAQKFSDAWGQQFIVDNRPGAGGNLAAGAVAKAAPDGYTWLISSSSLAIAPALFRQLPFDALKDLAPTSQIIATSHSLAVHPSMPNSLKDLVALAKSQPGKLNYGHAGTATASHLLGEMLRFATDADIVIIPYKGDAQAVPAILANEVAMGFVPPTNVISLVRAGKLKVLAMSGNTRNPAFPDAPTTTEAGFPEVQYVGWVSLFAPAGTPRELQYKLATEVGRIMKMPDIIEQLPRLGGDAAGTMPEEFSARFRSDVARYSRIIERAKIPSMD